MQCKSFTTVFFLLLVHSSLFAQQRLSNELLELTLESGKEHIMTYKLKAGEKSWSLNAPEMEINGKQEVLAIGSWQQHHAPVKLSNQSTEYAYIGKTKVKGVNLVLIIRMAPDNPVVRFRYELNAETAVTLTKLNGKDHAVYTKVSFKDASQIKEVRLSEFNEKAHATHLTEAVVEEGFFRNQLSIMGPIITASYPSYSFLLAYEHGSQYPDRFLEFGFTKSRIVGLRAVKANYLTNQEVSQEKPFQSLWFEVGAVKGNEEMLAAAYRAFILLYMAENNESRKPYIYYNTWGRQERVKWRGNTYNATMNLDYTLKEIDKANEMGVDVYVIDASWFLRTGDWQVNTKLFPDSLKTIKAKLDSYGMKLGLWFNPTVAGINSIALKKNLSNIVMRNGRNADSLEIWETEYSKSICLVSDYWEYFSDELIRLIKETGVSYFKWDAIGQYSCNAPGHHHGDSRHSYEESGNRFAFLLPGYMGKVIDKVHRLHPNSIFDFDITEDSRSVGLEFLAHGKYFIINNGPYFHNFDLGEEWKAPTPDGNPNMFVNAGAARGWFLRTVLDYDKWIPSILFLAHYYPYTPEWSQMQNIASLMLGQNGIWGELDSVDATGTALFNKHLQWYKQIRNDITQSSIVRTGMPGDSHEIYEKIDRKTGKGIVVLFANSKGSYTYVTKAKVHQSVIVPPGVNVRIDENGAAVIEVSGERKTAFIIYFGVK